MSDNKHSHQRRASEVIAAAEGLTDQDKVELLEVLYGKNKPLSA